ncbi:LPXTG cell wall anchor domain-containing protein [Listeria grandensis]|uniref:MucBP domain-containing protein n=1 Tax=Listeria grandensis TaxID=1494963 RepID=UPI0016259B6E|nr:MucBP domain-containing protein [Listeria grandensis]MBC1475004.1 LPXTG cell wall anchor domain-containing protein [Listeria grandensis]
MYKKKVNIVISISLIIILILFPKGIFATNVEARVNPVIPWDVNWQNYSGSIDTHYGANNFGVDGLVVLDNFYFDTSTVGDTIPQVQLLDYYMKFDTLTSPTASTDWGLRNKTTSERWTSPSNQVVLHDPTSTLVKVIVPLNGQVVNTGEMFNLVGKLTWSVYPGFPLSDNLGFTVKVREPQVVKVYYKNSADGSDIATNDTLGVGLGNGASVTGIAKDLTSQGWTFSGDNSLITPITATDGNGSNVVTTLQLDENGKQAIVFWYFQVAQDVTVKYQDENGIAIPGVADKTISGNIGEPYDATTTGYKADLPGYYLDETKLPMNGKGTLTGNPQTVIYIYHIDQTAVQAHDMSIYVGDSWDAKDNFDSATSREGSDVPFGDSIVVEGTVDTTKVGTYPVKYSYGGIDTTINVTVKANQTAVNVHDSVIYVGDTWNEEDNFDNATNKDGAFIDFAKFQVEGQMVGTVDTTRPGQNEVTYIYNGVSKSASVTVKAVGAVTVNYVDTQGTPIAPPDTKMGRFGVEYQTEAKIMRGWKLKTTPSNASGVFTDLAQTVTYVYEKEAGGNITVNYVDRNGKSLIKPEIKTGKYGEPYKTETKSIMGWKLKTTPSNASGVFTDQPQTVTYVYEKEAGGNITVNYVDESGKALTSSEIKVGQYGDRYTTEAKKIAGWKLKEVPVNANGTFTDEPQIVRYVYEKIYNGVVEKPTQPQSNPLGEARANEEKVKPSSLPKTGDETKANLLLGGFGLLFILAFFKMLRK